MKLGEAPEVARKSLEDEVRRRKIRREERSERRTQSKAKEKNDREEKKKVHLGMEERRVINEEEEKKRRRKILNSRGKRTKEKQSFLLKSIFLLYFLLFQIARVCAADEWLRSHPIRVEWFGGQFVSGAIAGDHPLVRLVQTSHATLHEGKEPEVRKRR